VFTNGTCTLNPSNDTVIESGTELLIVRQRPMEVAARSHPWRRHGGGEA
jgi:hypothetical protein